MIFVHFLTGTHQLLFDNRLSPTMLVFLWKWKKSSMELSLKFCLWKTILLHNSKTSWTPSAPKKNSKIVLSAGKVMAPVFWVKQEKPLQEHATHIIGHCGKRKSCFTKIMRRFTPQWLSWQKSAKYSLNGFPTRSSPATHLKSALVEQGFSSNVEAITFVNNYFAKKLPSTIWKS